MSDDIGYISPWGIKQPKKREFTDMELALMEGGHSLESPKEEKFSFLKEISMRANEFVSELFDPKEASPLEWDESNPYAVYANGHVQIGGHDVAIDITFSFEDEGVVNIEFMVGGEFEITGRGGASKVFATVIEAVKKFVKQRPKTVNVITFTAEERSRAKMYDTITKRIASQLGWHVVPYEEVAQDPRFKTAMSYGAFLFVIEKGQAPEHRKDWQKPQHSKFATVFYVYSREEDLPVYKVQAKKASDAERFVIQTVPEYQKTHPMGVFAGTVPIPGAIDLGEVPPPKPKPEPRQLTPLEQKLRDKLGADK